MKPNASIVPMILSRRLRASPYETRVIEQGVKAFSLYNKMTLPLVFEDRVSDYEHLRDHVQIWDVACERQVEVSGPDALRLVELITPRDISRCEIGQCMYAPLCDEYGGIINDPVILRLADDRFWLSIADSDVLLWVKGIVYGRGFNVRVFEPDVSPLAIQGPRSDELMSDVIGEQARDIRFFRFINVEIAGTDVVLARSGWSGQGGFEVYLQDHRKGLDLWDTFWNAGQKYNVRSGGPNLIDRLEKGLKSYGSDMTIDSNPFESGLESFISLNKEAECMSIEALKKIEKSGPEKRLVNLVVDGAALKSPRSEWSVQDANGQHMGIVTSLAWSPSMQANLAFAIINAASADRGTVLSVDADNDVRKAVVHDSNWKLH